MKTKGTIFTMIVALIEKVYSFLWGDLIHIPLPGGGSVGISLLIILLIPTGIYFVRTRLLPIMFPDMIKALTKRKKTACVSLSLWAVLFAYIGGAGADGICSWLCGGYTGKSAGQAISNSVTSSFENT